MTITLYKEQVNELWVPLSALHFPLPRKEKKNSSGVSYCQILLNSLGLCWHEAAALDIVVKKKEKSVSLPWASDDGPRLRDHMTEVLLGSHKDLWLLRRK